MSGELTTFEAIKPVGTCGACGRDLYPHSTPNICDYRQDCSMHGEPWKQYQLALKMRNTFIGSKGDAA